MAGIAAGIILIALVGGFCYMAEQTQHAKDKTQAGVTTLIAYLGGLLAIGILFG